MYFSMVLGLTNGLIGSIPMIQAPSKVSEENRELTGTKYIYQSLRLDWDLELRKQNYVIF